MDKISCILPTFNEKDNVLDLIEDIHQRIKDYNHEIIVVDDNSPDGTAQAVRGLNDSRVRVIMRTDCSGYARAIRCGIENATGDSVVIMDSDFNHLPQYILVMIPFLTEYDCVSASRFIKGGQMFPWWRSLCSWLFNGFIRTVTGGTIKDNLFGFFVIKRDVLLRCPWDDIFWGFGDYGIRLLYYLQNPLK